MDDRITTMEANGPPPGAPGTDASGWRQLLYRFTLHLSIGEAF